MAAKTSVPGEPTAYLDPRAGSGPLLRPLQRAGVPVIHKRSRSADFYFTGRGKDGKPVKVGVEIKKLGDLIQSLLNNRLTEGQLPRLISNHDIRWLLIVGDYTTRPDDVILIRKKDRGKYRPNYSLAFTYSTIEGMYLTFLERSGVSVWRTRNELETVVWLRTLFHWWTAKAYDKHRAHLGRGGKVRRDGDVLLPDITESWARELSGIGREKAALVATLFGGAREMANAGVKRWVEGVPGVGRELAARIVREIETGKRQRRY